MKLYKFRPLRNQDHLDRIIDIFNNGFFCCNFMSFNDMNEGVFRINHSNVNIRVEDKLNYKICSFSEVRALKSELMWGHYASTGMGVAIEVEIFPQFKEKIFRIRYTNDRNDLINTKDILSRKSKEWRYEKEFRYLSTDQIQKIKIGEITHVYFGAPYAHLVNYNEIKAIHPELMIYLEQSRKLKEICALKTIPFDDFILLN